MCARCVCVSQCMCVCAHFWGCMLFFHCAKENANYWASGSVKCTDVVTVSARWTIELVYNLTVGGYSHSHPKNHPVALPSSANVNQQIDFKAQGNQAIPEILYLNPLVPLFTVCKAIS